MEEEKGCRKRGVFFFFFSPPPFPTLFRLLFRVWTWSFPHPKPQKDANCRDYSMPMYSSPMLSFFSFSPAAKKKIGFRIVSKIKYTYKKERKKVLMKEEDRAKETTKRKRRSWNAAFSKLYSLERKEESPDTWRRRTVKERKKLTDCFH